MDKDEIIGQRQAVIAQLERENELLRARIRHLEAQLANYENAHTPPSLRRGGMRKTSLWIESVLLRCCTWMKRQSRSMERSTESGHSPHQPAETFVVIRKSRGTNVLMDVLTRRFKGLIVCDGGKPYARFTNSIQRCWPGASPSRIEGSRLEECEGCTAA